MMETLLLEPHPFEAWIAYRTDGVRGSGTLSDPWDGSSAEIKDHCKTIASSVFGLDWGV